MLYLNCTPIISTYTIDFWALTIYTYNSIVTV